jgi:hypothetical protein
MEFKLRKASMINRKILVVLAKLLLSIWAFWHSSNTNFFASSFAELLEGIGLKSNTSFSR